MDFSCNGIWWLPDQEQDKIAGTLKFSDEDGAYLSLSGVLGSSRGTFEEKNVPLIHGLVYDCPLGNLLTLKDSFLSSFSMGMPGFGRESYHVGMVFGGQHLSAHEFLFSEAEVRYSGLSGWAHGLTGLSHSFLRNEGPHGAWEIRWSWPEPISGEIPGGSLTLGVGASFSNGLRQSSINEEVAIKLNFNEPRSDVSISADYAYPLQNFFTLATDQVNALVELAVWRPNERQKIRVVAPRIFHEPKEIEYLLPHKMIFSLMDIRDSAVKLLGKWIEVYEGLRNVCAPFFAIQYKPSYTDFAFLTVFQSLQLYQSMGSSEANEQERLRRVLVKYWDVIGSLFRTDINGATSQLVQLRDYLVHRDSKLGDQPDYALNLYWSGQRLAFLLKACLLSELGFSTERINEFFVRNQAFLHLQSLK